jgi:hypothetical protein
MMKLLLCAERTRQRHNAVRLMRHELAAFTTFAPDTEVDPPK